MPDLPSQVFKTNDIRGVYPHELDERFSFLLGRAIARVRGARRVVVGRDGRLSSSVLHAALDAGLRKEGVETDSLGLCPTELLYYLMGATDRWDLGVMITASHNPPEFNGFKVVAPGGAPISGHDLRDSVVDVDSEEGLAGQSSLSAPLKSVHPEEDYLDFALKVAPVGNVASLRVVVDAGNGVGGILWERLADRTGVDLVPLNFTPDGRFPSHPPDPSRHENLVPLRDRVLTAGADLGLAYDGDADRVFCILAGGRIVSGSEMIGAVADHIMSDVPHEQLALGFVTSKHVLAFFRQRSIEPVLVPVGHARIKACMRANAALAFAAEESGHCYYREFFRCDSALVTTLHLLRMTAEGEWDRFWDRLPAPWFRRDTRFAFSRRSAARRACIAVAREVLGRFSDAQEIICEAGIEVRRHCPSRQIEDADGVRVEFPDWWFCARPSETEPLLRLAVAAEKERDLEDKADLLIASVQNHLA